MSVRNTDDTHRSEVSKIVSRFVSLQCYIRNNKKTRKIDLDFTSLTPIYEINWSLNRTSITPTCDRIVGLSKMHYITIVHEIELSDLCQC